MPLAITAVSASVLLSVATGMINPNVKMLALMAPISAIPRTVYVGCSVAGVCIVVGDARVCVVVVAHAPLSLVCYTLFIPYIYIIYIINVIAHLVTLYY